MHARTAQMIGPGCALLLIASLLLTAPALAGARPPTSTHPAALAGAAGAPHGAITLDRPLAAPVTIDLCASVGSVTMPDGAVVPIWGFSLDSGGGCAPAQLPGPVLDVNAGDVITVNLTNVNVPQNVSLLFPGQNLAPDTAGVGAGSSATYTFTASAPGTYLYESGANAVRTVLMGLYGALIVRPTTAGRAYDSAATAYDEEATLVLSEIDPLFNASSASFNLVNYAPTYWLINGRAYPQTTAIPVAAGERLLLRYLNAGSIHHTMALLGAHQRAIARDAYPLAYPYDVVADTIPAGQTADMIVTIPPGAAGSSLPLYNRQLHLTNGNVVGGGTAAPHFPGGMLTFVTVAPGGPTNQPPTVSAGPDQTVSLPAAATLDGTVADDGLVAPLTTQWTQQSGPGTVTFGNASAVDTTASFSAAGTYVLRLTAFDGALSAFDELTVTVNSPDLIFASGFESGSFSGWTAEVDTEGDLNVTVAAALVGASGMAALIDNTTAMYVRDDTPLNEPRYRARFFFDPNSITMANGNLHRIMVARDTSNELVRIEFRRNAGVYQVRASVRSDGGGYASTAWFTISDAPHRIEFDWRAATSAGANNGYLSLWIDNSNSAAPNATVGSVDNDTHRVQQARLGPLQGIDAATLGTEYYDDFVSRRTTFIGP
ncbi:MAG TPA: multicopper oxidase domain-containing protein [Roseiflexaceae bacterium]|nr:multicopper oxidase domain-containing protein [Roseiflexaceae bacterium]